MQKFLKASLIIAVIALLAPLTFITSWNLYGMYLLHSAEEKKVEVSEQRELAASSGNGFGGDMGMDVVDSGLRVDTRFHTNQFFWIDDESLLFIASRDVNAPGNPVGDFVWNTRKNTMKPLAIEGVVTDYSAGKLSYIKLSAAKSDTNRSATEYRFQSTLKELDDKWVLDDAYSIDDIVGLPPHRYEIALTSDQWPWFRLKAEHRLESDVPEHRFQYLWEWGWIMRMPAIGAELLGHTEPEMGFIDIGGDIYADQAGRKVADLPKLPAEEVAHLTATYTGFLDRYWIVSHGIGDDAKAAFMAFLGRDGSIKQVLWPTSWRTYTGIPLPTRKGLFWIGPDYRVADPKAGDSGAFIRSSDNRVYKLVHGFATDASVSNDGCRIAFFNVPRLDSGAGSLKVANVCTSTMDGRGLRDVDY